MNEKIRILVVEDDNDINRLLCSIINRSGYYVQPSFSGTEAMLYLQMREWDMLILDLMLPGMSGNDILDNISEQFNGPIIIISAKLDQKTKVDMLRTGADDYITKPFDIEEVAARIDSVLRRYKRIQQLPMSKIIKHEDIELDLDQKKVFVNHVELSLTAREYDIFILFMSSPNKVFTKKNLFESVWGEEYYGDDNTMNVHISNIRSKLAKANPGKDYIETVWGMEYRLKT